MTSIFGRSTGLLPQVHHNPSQRWYAVQLGRKLWTAASRKAYIDIFG